MLFTVFSQVTDTLRQIGHLIVRVIVEVLGKLFSQDFQEKMFLNFKHFAAMEMQVQVSSLRV